MELIPRDTEGEPGIQRLPLPTALLCKAVGLPRIPAKFMKRTDGPVKSPNRAFDGVSPNFALQNLAERLGFEPRSHLLGDHTPSKRALSTTQTPLPELLLRKSSECTSLIVLEILRSKISIP